MGIIGEEIGRYDPYTDKFIKNTTPDRIEIGTDGNLYRLSVSNGNKYLPMDRLYTKADMVAMLTDIQLEIKELWDNRYDVWLDNQYYIGKNDTLEEVDDIIQQKINSLKEVKKC